MPRSELALAQNIGLGGGRPPDAYQDDQTAILDAELAK